MCNCQMATGERQVQTEVFVLVKEAAGLMCADWGQVLCGGRGWMGGCGADVYRRWKVSVDQDL